MIIETCPTCNMKRDPEYRFCGWCGRDLMKRDDTTCYECGSKIKKAEEFKRVFKDILCGIR